jgi:Tail-tube assembly protein
LWIFDFVAPLITHKGIYMPGSARRRYNHPAAVIGATKNSRSLAGLVFPAGDNKLNMGMLFKFVKYSITFGSGVKAAQATNLTNAHIALPLPEGLQDTLNINYDVVDMGVVSAGLQSGEAVGNDLKNKGAIEGLKTFGKRAAGDTEYLARTAINQLGAVGSGLNAASGNVPNPFTTTVFKNVDLRKHTLTWKLTPETPEDSIAIKNIINLFKWEALPGGGAGSPFLTMPNEVMVDFFGTNALYGFGRCVITGVTVNYNPTNVPAFYKNIGQGLISAPQQVELQVQLSEVEQLTGGVFAATKDYGGQGGATQTVQSTGDASSESLPQDQRPGNRLVNENVNDPVRQYDVEE